MTICAQKDWKYFKHVVNVGNKRTSLGLGNKSMWLGLGRDCGLSKN